MSTSSDDEPQSPEKRQEAKDKLVPKLDPAEYGRMPPSYHDKSQRVGKSKEDHETETEISPEEEKEPETQQAKVKPIRQPIIPRDTYDGVDSDDETDDEDPELDSDDEENQPQVVGDVEVDMEEEEEEFLEFSRQALGISDDQWSDMIKDRKERGGEFLTVSLCYKHVEATFSVCAKDREDVECEAPAERSRNHTSHTRGRTTAQRKSQSRLL